MKFSLLWKAKMKVYDEKLNSKQKRNGRGVGEPIAKFEYSIRRNVLRKMMQPKWSWPKK